MVPSAPRLAPWAKVCRSFGAEFFNEPLAHHTSFQSLSPSTSGPAPVADYLPFEGTHLTQTAQVALGLTESCRQKRLDQVPGHRRSNGPAAHANNVHVIVLDPLPSREMVVH